MRSSFRLELSFLVSLVGLCGFLVAPAAALITTALAPLHAWYLAGPWTALAVAIVCALIWFRHRQNIARLLRGEEPEIGRKK